jgi:uncharacterized protein with von Willebrand factor type A (vWA) domain
MAAPAELPLLGLFQALRRAGVPLGLRDYLDALRALRAGFGQGGRAELLRLCGILWCRSADEHRLLAAAVVAIAPPSAQEVAELEERRREYESRRKPWPGSSALRAPAPDAAVAGAGAAPSPTTRVAFDAPAAGGGLALPRLQLELVPSEAYALERESLVSARDLAVVWRRLRRLVRSGPATEIDVEVTLRRQSRDGVLTAVALRPQRRNTARLLLLIDVSPSMAPWQGFLDNLAASLPLSRLRHAEAFYFANVPQAAVFRSGGLDDPVELDGAFFAARRGAALLVVSDAGAARARFSRGRLSASRAFLHRAAADLAPIVWLNPLPPARWPRTTAQALARERRATFLPLSDAMLIRAADLLRGAKAA